MADLGDNDLMNQINEPDSQPSEEQSQSVPQAPASNPGPSAPVAPVFDPRRRLRELLSIPESQRTDPQWDEIIELEVQLAPGNRIGQEGQGGGKRPQGQPHSHSSGNRGGGGGAGGGGTGGGGNSGGGNFKRHGSGRKFPKAKKPPQV
jgi:hypothetical protein